MPATPTVSSALEALDGCDLALVKLNKTCCDPGRSPQMLALERTLADARHLIVTVSSDSGAAQSAVMQLESAGAQVGRLQVTCCTENRMSLYATMLTGLSATQIRLNTALGTGH